MRRRYMVSGRGALLSDKLQAEFTSSKVRGRLLCGEGKHISRLKVGR